MEIESVQLKHSNGDSDSTVSRPVFIFECRKFVYFHSLLGLSKNNTWNEKKYLHDKVMIYKNEGNKKIQSSKLFGLDIALGCDWVLYAGKLALFISTKR